MEQVNRDCTECGLDILKMIIMLPMMISDGKERATKQVNGERLDVVTSFYFLGHITDGGNREMA